MSITAMKQALEALEGVLDDSPKVLDASISGGLYEVVQCRDAITAIKAALEAKDEPVAYLPPTASPDNACYIPPQRTWVGLTDDEIVQMGLSNYIKVVRETEAKLKQKNE
jgi:hypothetical protein